MVLLREVLGAQRGGERVALLVRPVDELDIAASSSWTAGSTRTRTLPLRCAALRRLVEQRDHLARELRVRAAQV